MAISSNSLFHYTDSINALKGILKNGFRLSYCLEEFMAYPMVSFCDIPLSHAKEHFKNYGNYAIGMKLQWGIENKLNPVLYVEKNSYFRKQYLNGLKIIPEIQKLREAGHKTQELRDVLGFVLDTNRFSKPYKGSLIRGSTVFENYKFYDEREWRYIPEIYQNKFEGALDKDDYNAYKIKHPKKPHLKEGLTFKAVDIKYLLVQSENDIPKIINFLMTLQNLGNSKDIQLLLTKIITAEQISEDM